MEGMLAGQTSKLIARLKRSETDRAARVGIVHEERKATILTLFLNRDRRFLDGSNVGSRGPICRAGRARLRGGLLSSDHALRGAPDSFANDAAKSLSAR
jgi:hypothetical protein